MVELYMSLHYYNDKAAETRSLRRLLFDYG